MSKFIEDFKAFALKGNVMDMAIGVIIGGAFGKIVSSLVNDVIMPLIGIITGGIDFSKLLLAIGDAKVMYGLFIQNVIDFLIIALSIFIAIKAIAKMHKKHEEPTTPTMPEPTTTEKLLAEIRDELKKK